jgi:hypothetical protein
VDERETIRSLERLLHVIPDFLAETLSLEPMNLGKPIRVLDAIEHLSEALVILGFTD